jgi:hypothetical protein
VLPGAVPVGVGVAVAENVTVNGALSSLTLPAASCWMADTEVLPAGTDPVAQLQVVPCTVAVQAANDPAKTVTKAPSSPVPETALPVVCAVEPGVGEVIAGGAGESESI